MEHKCKKTDIKTTEKCELNRDEIIKALEIHSDKEDSCMNKCPYSGRRYCGSDMANDALSLIKELTEENERLNQSCTNLEQECKKWQDRIKIECEYTERITVRKMQERFIAEIEQTPNANEHFIKAWTSKIDQIAKEMLEEGTE
jgi:hypothetical protein